MATDGKFDRSTTAVNLKESIVAYFTNLNGFSIVRGGVLLFTALLWLIPLIALLYVAAQPTEGLLSGSFWAFPDRFALVQNMMQAWTQAEFKDYAINSLIYASIGSVVAVFLASLEGSRSLG